MSSESRSGVSQEANSAALTVRAAWIRRRSRSSRGSQRRNSRLAAQLLTAPATARGDRQQGQLGCQQGRREQGQQRAPGRRGRGRRGGCARASATCRSRRRTRSRGRRPPSARSRLRAAAQPQPQREVDVLVVEEELRGEAADLPPARSGIARQAPESGRDLARRRAPRQSGAPWPPAQTMPVKWIGLPAELIARRRPRRRPAPARRPSRAPRARAGGSPRRSPAAAPRRG